MSDFSVCSSHSDRRERHYRPFRLDFGEMNDLSGSLRCSSHPGKTLSASSKQLFPLPPSFKQLFRLHKRGIEDLAVGIVMGDFNARNGELGKM